MPELGRRDDRDAAHLFHGQQVLIPRHQEVRVDGQREPENGNVFGVTANRIFLWIRLGILLKLADSFKPTADPSPFLGIRADFSRQRPVDLRQDVIRNKDFTKANSFLNNFLRGT